MRYSLLDRAGCQTIPKGHLKLTFTFIPRCSKIKLNIPKLKLETLLDPCIQNQSKAVCMAFRNPTIQLQKQNRHDKGPFNNYIDMILPLFDHLPTST
jgi:hypothetical protein